MQKALILKLNPYELCLMTGHRLPTTEGDGSSGSGGRGGGGVLG